MKKHSKKVNNGVSDKLEMDSRFLIGHDTEAQFGAVANNLN